LKFCIETYGCQMNVSDSELVSRILVNAGWEETTDLDEADLILFNTCSVRKHAEDRVLGRISNEKHRKSGKPELKIGVLGCMAQNMGKRLLDDKLGIDYVIGVDQYDHLPQILDETRSLNIDFDTEQVYPGLAPLHHNSSCAFVTIMRGCNNFCSYCIVPHVRGRERSVPAEAVMEEVRRCGELGLKDVTLLGQNVNSYNYQGLGFAGLLRELNGIEGIYRLRFITSHPKDLSDELVEVMAGCDKVCNHIHLPMQSGDNGVLRRMNRKYTIEHYLALVQKLRHVISDLAITTDLIAGFPGESDAGFQNTLEAMKLIRFDYAFCFKYSEREGTAALELPGNVPEQLRLERLQQMIDLQREITYQKFAAQVGRTVEVYVEDLSRKSKTKVSGKTRDFKIAVLDGTEDDIGKLRSAQVTEATPGTLICGTPAG
jgi:tRNA-2-methylthio-N6-dimethylallyladenosine synthase